MRKFLAAILAVMMIMATLAVLPVSAEDEVVYKSPFDGTDASYADSMPLVITEVMSNTTASVYEEGTPNYSANAFQYIEVYNKGDEAINLYDLALVRGLNKISTDPWESQRKFLETTGGKGVKLSLNPGNIYEDAYGASGNVAVNQPGTCYVEPGEFAIIWFWNDSSNSVSNTFGASLGQTKADAEGKPVFHYYFREHYKSQTTDPAAKAQLQPFYLLIIFTVHHPHFLLRNVPRKEGIQNAFFFLYDLLDLMLQLVHAVTCGVYTSFNHRSSEISHLFHNPLGRGQRHFDSLPEHLVGQIVPEHQSDVTPNLIAQGVSMAMPLVDGGLTSPLLAAASASS